MSNSRLLGDPNSYYNVYDDSWRIVQRDGCVAIEAAAPLSSAAVFLRVALALIASVSAFVVAEWWGLESPVPIVTGLASGFAASGILLSRVISDWKQRHLSRVPIHICRRTDRLSIHDASLSFDLDCVEGLAVIRGQRPGNQTHEGGGGVFEEIHVLLRVEGSQEKLFVLGGHNVKRLAAELSKLAELTLV